jgi:hypothetical protein
MKIQRRVVSVLFAVATVSLDCRANPKDDQFARSFIDRLNRRDSSAVAQFEPSNELTEAGWNRVVTAADRLPAPPVDSIRLVEWEHGTDPRHTSTLCGRQKCCPKLPRRDRLPRSLSNERCSRRAPALRNMYERPLASVTNKAGSADLSGRSQLN